MDKWRQIIELAKVELKVSSVNLLLCWLSLPFFGIILLFDMSTEPIDEIPFYHDSLLILALGVAPLLFRAKYFQYNKITQNIWASPTLIMQTQLPIPLDVLVRSRLFIYFTYFIPATCLIFIGSYIMNHHLRALLSLPEYFVFSFIWLTIGFSLGMIIAASDVGDLVTTKIMLANSILLFAIISIVLLFFYKVIGESIFSFIVLLAQEYSLLAMVSCFILITLSWLFWPRYMKKAIQKLDYL